MLRDRFYDLIDAARGRATPTGPSADPGVLRSVLGGLEPSELVEFVLAFDDELIRLNRWSVCGAGYVSEGGMSDDGFHYFRSWLVGKGREAVDAVLRDADSLAEFLDEGEHENEALEYVATDLLEEHGLPDPRDRIGRPHADEEPTGEAFDQATVESSYPRTAAAIA